MSTVALDAMGGDHGVSVTVPAAINALAKYPNLRLILVGDEAAITQQLRQEQYSQSQRLRVVHASQVVAMDEKPSIALRSKKDSSMRVAINLVKQGEAGACVSAGNTGALMATARFVLRTLPGIDRPAILSTFPSTTKDKLVRVLDLGANIDCSAEHLYQFAIMGSVLAQTVDGIKHPSVCLLNVGEEEMKGNEQVQQAAQLLNKRNDINYQGFCEGHDFFSGNVDVVVCDGFAGNVALKAVEGVTRLMSGYMRQEFKASIFSRLCAFIAYPVLKAVKKRMDPSRYNGACFLGLRGTVIKSHGSANALGMRTAIQAAMLQAEQNVPDQIEAHLSNILQDESHA